MSPSRFRHALFVMVLIAATGCVALAAERRPDSIVFLSDDHGLLDSTPYGATDVRTPNMQRLAAAGMTFTHNSIASPACAPSRTALLTGLMPARNGSEVNHTFKREDIRSLPEALNKLGYEVAAVGKVVHSNDVTMSVRARSTMICKTTRTSSGTCPRNRRTPSDWRKCGTGLKPG